MLRMKTIQVGDVPDEVHRTLRRRADAAGLSLSDYVLGELTRLAERPSVAELLGRAGARAGAPGGAATVAVRAGRDRE